MATVQPDIHYLACIGLMGSGKSTIGRMLAERLGWAFVDVDDTIEATTGSTVAELWERGGEERYRPLERKVVIDVLRATEHVVLATPGGVVLDREASNAIAAPDVAAVYLRATPATLAARIAGDTGHKRPLVDDQPAAVMRAMFEARDRSYEHLADHVVQVDELTPDQAAIAVHHLLIGSVLRPDPADAER
ncbi:MAG: shikimate kinase [Acidimicrobiales bacterium]|nr:shikimate kinase [Acidimicrobiales bacterium]